MSSRSSDTAWSRKNVARMIGPATQGRRHPHTVGKRNSGTAAIFSRVVTSAATALVAVPVVAGLSGYLWWDGSMLIRSSAPAPSSSSAKNMTGANHTALGWLVRFRGHTGAV